MSVTRATRPVLIVHAEGDEEYAQRLAAPIQDAGYAVVHLDAGVERRFRGLLLSACDIIDLANLPADRQLVTRQLALRSLFVPLQVRVEREAGLDIDADELLALERRRRPPGSVDATASAPRVGDRSVLAPVGLRLRQSRRLVILGDPGAGRQRCCGGWRPRTCCGCAAILTGPSCLLWTPCRTRTGCRS